MKELSIEEKAKAYDEAISMAEKFYTPDSNNVNLKATLEMIFPELKESEDGKMRAMAIKAVYAPEAQSCIKSWGINPDDVIAWLEKQGEQNYKIIKGKNYFCVKTHNYAGVEWIKGTKYYASDNYTLVNQGCEYYCPEYSKEEHNNLFEEVKCDGCVEKQGEQKPVELSQEELDELKREIVRLSTLNLDADKDSKEISLWKTYFLSLPQKQKPAWSEDDENRINRLIAYFEDKESLTAEDDIIYANWLKSIKDRCITTNPHWKPSDEHYELEEFAKIVRCNLTGISKAVQELFEAKYTQLTGNKMYRGFKD